MQKLIFDPLQPVDKILQDMCRMFPTQFPCEERVFAEAYYALMVNRSFVEVHIRAKSLDIQIAVYEEHGLLPGHVLDFCMDFLCPGEKRRFTPLSPP